MTLENILKFFKKNGVLLVQITVLSLPFLIFFIYFSVGENSNTLDVASIEKVEILEEAKTVQKVDKAEKEQNKIPQQEKNDSTFEIDEVSQEMLNKNAANPKEMLANSNSACTNFENVQTLAKHLGTISKAKNIEQFKKPLPAMITETQYVCVDGNGARKTKFTTMGVGVDAQANALRCIQSNSDETMNSEERFKHVLKIMTHHCGFKLLSEKSPK